MAEALPERTTAAPRDTRPASERLWTAVLYLVTGLTLAFLVLPIVAIVPLSINESQFLTYPIRGVTDRWYAEFLAPGRWTRALVNSILIGVVSAVVATVLGTLAAIGLSLAEFRGKRILMAVLISPLVVPVVVLGVGLALFFGKIGLSRTYFGLICAHVALASPFPVVTVSAALASFDRNLLRAAASLGAPPLVIFRRVMMPLILPGFLSGLLFAFATSFDEVVTNILIGGPEQRTLPREMLSSLRENISPTIVAAATVMTLVAVFLLAGVELSKRRARRLAGTRG